MELATAFEGGIFGGLVVGDIHVARKSNVQGAMPVASYCGI
jgi:hypothetical protein